MKIYSNMLKMHVGYVKIFVFILVIVNISKYIDRKEYIWIFNITT